MRKGKGDREKGQEKNDRSCCAGKIRNGDPGDSSTKILKVCLFLLHSLFYLPFVETSFRKMVHRGRHSSSVFIVPFRMSLWMWTKLKAEGRVDRMEDPELNANSFGKIF